MKNKPIIFGNTWLSTAEIMQIAENNYPVKLNADPKFSAKINAAVKFLTTMLQQEGEIYGVTTGYGDSCNNSVPPNLIHDLPINLTKFHGCGLGRYFNHKQARAIMAVRLCSLARGFSGVRLDLMQQIITMLNYDIAPIIPEEGSVGASGDLTPLSYLAATLMGERVVTYKGKQKDTARVFKALKIQPITLMPKEGLALMNGTAVMTALACEALEHSQYLCKLASRLTAMTSIALHGNPGHFDTDLFAVKPHTGQIQIAKWIKADLNYTRSKRNTPRLQDRYSLRCAPHVIGVIQDSIPWFRQMIENELNSANDNPIIDGKKQLILHGGHFYGGHIATVMDTMKTQVANLADLLDRQLAQLVDPKCNHGLPANLSFASKKRSSINHGFKAIQIAVSAWTAEALKNTMPASVFSRSTECHNQDKVSMGTIAARDCLRILELTNQVFAAHILATFQAISIRIKTGEIKQSSLSPAINTMLDDIAKNFTLVTEDRPLDATLRQFIAYIQQKRWQLYENI